MTELATELRSSIDAWTDQLWRESKLAQLARHGALSERAMALYLESLRFLFHHSQHNLVAAQERARALNDERLANIFGAKAAEEIGHDQWASRDLSVLTVNALDGIEPAAASRQLVELQRQLIMEHHPLCFFAYSLWAEYMTVRLGDAWLSALANNGYARGAVTAVANHVDADREHAAEGLAVLDQLWDGKPERALILRSVVQAQALFEAFCDEIAAVSVEQRMRSSHSGEPRQK
jgi:hypothetical protein